MQVHADYSGYKIPQEAIKEKHCNFELQNTFHWQNINIKFFPLLLILA